MFNVIRTIKKCHILINNGVLILNRKIHSLKTIDIPNVYVEETIWRNLHKWPDKTALVCVETNRSYTYQQLYNKSKSIATFLHKFGLARNDTVAIVLPNVPEYPIIFLGACQAGLKITTINPAYTPGEISKQFFQSDTKIAFTTNEFYNVVNQALQLAKLQIPIVAIQTQGASLMPNGSINFKDIADTPSSNFLHTLQRDLNDTMVLPFSSGTTGRPKGVELTNTNIAANLHQMSSDEFDIIIETNGCDQDVVPAVLPMYHIYGMVAVMLRGLMKGCKLVTIPKFSSKIYVTALENHHPTVMFTVPPIMEMLISNSYVKRSHFMKMRTIMCGGASLGKSRIDALSEKFGRELNFVQGYGMTETSPMTHIQTAGIKFGIKPGGIGFLIPSTEAKIASPENGEDMGINEIGEILIRGPQVMKGYYKNEKATEETLTRDGWLKSGDLGYYDEDGHFFITGRIKEMIKVKGYQVAPIELEELIRELPGIEDVAVVGVPHTKLGEAPKAFVVCKRDSNITSEMIEEYVKKRVINYKQLNGGVLLMNSIPKSPSGKVLKNQLKDIH